MVWRVANTKCCWYFLSFYLEYWNVNIHINFYYSTQHFVAFRKWSQCNKARQIIFHRGWQIVPEYSIHFLLQKNLVKFIHSTCDMLTSRYCFISLKRNFLPNSSWQSVVFLWYIWYYCLKEKSWRNKRSVLALRIRWSSCTRPTSLDSPSLYQLFPFSVD